MFLLTLGWGEHFEPGFPKSPPAPGHQQNEEIKFAQAFPKKSGSGGSAQPSTYHYRALQTYIEI